MFGREKKEAQVAAPSTTEGYGRYATSPGVYEGRMVANGDGHLIADEGPLRGLFVAYDAEIEGFVLVLEGTQTHNVRHHLGFGHVEPTADLA